MWSGLIICLDASSTSLELAKARVAVATIPARTSEWFLTWPRKIPDDETDQRQQKYHQRPDSPGILLTRPFAAKDVGQERTGSVNDFAF